MREDAAPARLRRGHVVAAPADPIPQSDRDREEDERRLGLLDGPLLAAATGRVLEVGCGAGRLLRKVRAQASLTVGVDVEQDALRRAALVAPQGLLRARAETLPFRARTFDAVVAGYHVFSSPTLDWQAAFIEIGRVLAPGGVLVFTSWTRFGLTTAGWRRALAAGRLPTEEERRPTVPLFRDSSHLDGLLRAGGLVRERLWGLPMLGPIRRITGPIRIHPGPLAPLCYEIVVRARRR